MVQAKLNPSLPCAAKDGFHSGLAVLQDRPHCLQRHRLLQVQQSILSAHSAGRDHRDWNGTSLTQAPAHVEGQRLSCHDWLLLANCNDCVDACSWQGTRSSACWQSPKAKATVRCNRPQSSAQPISIRYEPAPCMSRIQIQTGSGCHTTCTASMCLPGLELLCVLQLQTPRSGWATSCLSEAHIGMQGMEALAPSSPLSAPYLIVVCMPRTLSVCLASCTAC